jgi:hypothetical protein
MVNKAKTNPKEPESNEEYEVVKMLVGKKTKAVLMETAKREYRDFQHQCRMVLDEWAESKCKKDNKKADDS